MVIVVPDGEVATECRASRPMSSDWTMRLPRLPTVGQAWSSGRPTPSSAIWIRMASPLRRCRRVSTRPLSRPSKACRKALVRILGNEQPDAPRGTGVDLDLLGDHVDAHAVPAVEMPDRRGDAADVGTERNLGLAGRGDAGFAEFLVEQLQRLDPAGEHGVVLARLGAAGLHAHEADDHREVVLDPVIDFRELGLHRFEPCVLVVRVPRALGAEEVLDLAALHQRRDRQAVEKRGPVGAVVGDLDRDVLAGRDRRPDARDPVEFGFRPLQEPAVAPDDRLHRIAGQLGEGGVGINDRVVGEVGVGQHQRERQARQGGRRHLLGDDRCHRLAVARHEVLAPTGQAARSVRCSMRFSWSP